MRTTTVAVAVAAGLLTSGSTAIQLIKRAGAPAVVPMSIERRAVEVFESRYQFDQLRKRQKTVSQTLDNFEVRLASAQTTSAWSYIPTAR